MSSLMKAFDFMPVSLWVFLLDLGLDVPISWLHLCLETHAGSFLLARMSQARAACEPFCFLFESAIPILSSAGSSHLRLHSGSISRPQAKSNRLKLLLFKISNLICVGGPCLPNVSTVGGPPVHIFTGLTLNYSSSSHPGNAIKTPA